ncbi:hypothetical protein HDU93_006369, partial [Gonapodya sp. JEL0774]
PSQLVGQELATVLQMKLKSAGSAIQRFEAERQAREVAAKERHEEGLRSPFQNPHQMLRIKTENDSNEAPRFTTSEMKDQHGVERLKVREQRSTTAQSFRSHELPTTGRNEPTRRSQERDATNILAILLSSDLDQPAHSRQHSQLSLANLALGPDDMHTVSPARTSEALRTLQSMDVVNSDSDALVQEAVHAEYFAKVEELMNYDQDQGQPPSPDLVQSLGSGMDQEATDNEPMPAEDNLPSP